MSPQYHACDILCRVATPVRARILGRMPATAQEYAIHGAWCVMAIEHATDRGDDARAERALQSARRALKAAADLGDIEAADLLGILPLPSVD